MAIVVNTNLQALNIQGNLSASTSSMNKAMERLSSGYRINSAKDDAAGAAISTNMETKLSGTSIAKQNAQIGQNLLTTTESTLDTIEENVQRIRDLVEQAANGTYDSTSKLAIQVEITQRMQEIDRLAAGTEFNGIRLLNGTQTAGVNLQIGTGNDTAAEITAGTGTNVLTLSSSLFADASGSGLAFDSSAFVTAFGASGTTANFNDLLADCDVALRDLSTRKTNIGAYQNRLDSAVTALDTQTTNVSAAKSTIMDADTAAESANYVKYQILQQASASLLASANQAPSLALTLIQGG